MVAISVGKARHSLCGRVFRLDEKVGPGDLLVVVTGSGFGGTLASVNGNAIREQVHFGELLQVTRWTCRVKATCGPQKFRSAAKSVSRKVA